MFHMSLWSRVAGPLNVQHVLETDCNWQDNKAHNVKKGVCVCVCICTCARAGYWDDFFDENNT